MFQLMINKFVFVELSGQTEATYQIMITTSWGYQMWKTGNLSEVMWGNLHGNQFTWQPIYMAT